MIQKARVYPQYQYAPEKYQLDHFHNPYLAKLSLKITPRLQPSQSKFTFISPVSTSNNLYLSHSIPILKNDHLRIALVWREYLAHKFARANFGVSIEHKIHQNYKIKGLLLTGTNSLMNIQFSKRLKNNIETFAGYSGFLENTQLYSNLTLGLRKDMYSFAITHKLSSQTEFKMGLSKQIKEDINLSSTLNGNPLEPQRSQIDLRLTQQIDKSNSTSLALTFNPYYKQLSLKVQYQRSLTKYHRLLLCNQYTQKSNVIYLGYKNLNFNIAFPIVVIDSVIPIILSIVGFGAACIYQKLRNKQKKNVINLDQQEEGTKKESERVEELKIISEKAADIYEKQKSQANGLLIEQAYIGPEGELQEFMNNPQRLHLLLRNQQYKNKFVDLTVSFRFYVSKNELKLRKGEKYKILGFYRKNNKCNKIGVRYSRRGVSRVEYFNYNDPIVIKKDQ